MELPNWKDRRVERENTFTLLHNNDGTITLIPVTGEVYEQGTLLNAVNLNKLNSFSENLRENKLNKPTIVKGQAGFDWKIVKFEDIKYVTAWKYIDITGAGWHKLELPLKLETEFGYSVTLSGSDGAVIPFLTEPSFEENSISVYISDNSNKYWRFRVMVNGFYIES